MYQLRCMGHMKFQEQCKKCARLPRVPEQEDFEHWMIPCETFPQCPKYIPAHQLVYRSTDNITQ